MNQDNKTTSSFKMAKKVVLDEKAIEIHNQIKCNSSLKERKPYEIAFFSSIFHYGEELQKEFECYTKLHDGTLVKGEFLITDERIMFFHIENGLFDFICFEYFELDEFYQGVLKDKSIGTLNAVFDEELYIFTGFMRFGLSIWVDYVNEKISEI